VIVGSWDGTSLGSSLGISLGISLGSSLGISLGGSLRRCRLPILYGFLVRDLSLVGFGDPVGVELGTSEGISDGTSDGASEFSSLALSASNLFLLALLQVVGKGHTW